MHQIWLTNSITRTNVRSIIIKIKSINQIVIEYSTAVIDGN